MTRCQRLKHPWRLAPGAAFEFVTTYARSVSREFLCLECALEHDEKMASKYTTTAGERRPL